MNRWRAVSQQNGGVEEIGGVVLAEEEAREFLLDQATIHERFGWDVTVGFNLDGEPDVVIARRTVGHHTQAALEQSGQPTPRNVERILTVREYDPLDDVGSWL